MYAIFTGGKTRKCIGKAIRWVRPSRMEKAMYYLLLLSATYFCVSVLIGCSGSSAPTQPTDETDGAPVEKETFQITLMGLDDLPLASPHKLAIMEAKRKWEDIITEGLPDVIYPWFQARFLPGQAHLSDSLKIDDIAIQLLWDSTPRNHLATTRAWGGTYRPTIPYFATITFSASMLNPSYDATAWEKVTLHEIGHALGFVSEELGRVGIENTNGVRGFKGEQAVKSYRDILYTLGETLAFARPDLSVPMESDPQAGHWKAPEVQWDIMSESVYLNSVLTGVTLGAMADIGHAVDMSKAQPPPRNLTKPTVMPHFFCDGTHIRIVSERGQ